MSQECLPEDNKAQRWIGDHWWDMVGIGSIIGAFLLFCHLRNIDPIAGLSRIIGSVNWIEIGTWAIFIALAIVGFSYFVYKLELFLWW